MAFLSRWRCFQSTHTHPLVTLRIACFATYVQTGFWFLVWFSSTHTVNVVILTHGTPADTGYFQVMGAHLPHPTLTWYQTRCR